MNMHARKERETGKEDAAYITKPQQCCR